MMFLTQEVLLLSLMGKSHGFTWSDIPEITSQSLIVYLFLKVAGGKQCSELALSA